MPSAQSSQEPLDPGSLSRWHLLSIPLRANSVHVSACVTLMLTLNGQHWPIFQGRKWELRVQRHVQGHIAKALQRGERTPARAASTRSFHDTPCFKHTLSCFQSLASCSPPPFLLLPCHLCEAWGKPGADGDLSPFPKETHLLRSQLQQPWLETKRTFCEWIHTGLPSTP